MQGPHWGSRLDTMGDSLGGTRGPPKPSPCLCQFDLKEKKSFFGQRKDYWDFLCQGLARRRQEHEGVRFVTSLDKVGTGHPGGLTGHPRVHACVCTPTPGTGTRVLMPDFLPSRNCPPMLPELPADP